MVGGLGSPKSDPGLSPLHPQCIALSAAVLDPLQHCSGGRSSRSSRSSI